MTDADERAHEERMQLWAFRRLIAIIIGGLLTVALLIPITRVLAGKNTSVTINAALTFSLVATASLAVTVPGWVRAHRGKGKEIERVRVLQNDKRVLEEALEALKAAQPTLDAEVGPESKDETR